MKHPPTLVCALVYGHDAWIVGSAAKRDVENPRDYDVLVPFKNWNAACFLIPPDATCNSFGGWKCNTSEGIEVDVWPGDLGALMTHDVMKYAWHPKTNSYYEKVG